MKKTKLKVKFMMKYQEVSAPQSLFKHLIFCYNSLPVYPMCWFDHSAPQSRGAVASLYILEGLNTVLGGLKNQPKFFLIFIFITSQTWTVYRSSSVKLQVYAEKKKKKKNLHAETKNASKRAFTDLRHAARN